jgi:hypothetical protein
MKTLLLLLLAPLCALSQSSGSIVNWVIVTSNSTLGPSKNASVGGSCANYNTGYVNALTGDQIICKNPAPLVSPAGTYTINNSGGGSNPTLNAVLDPTAAKAFALSGFALSFTGGAATSTTNIFTVQDTAGNTGTGYVFTVQTATGSAAKPFQVNTLAGNIIDTDATGGLTLGSNDFTQPVIVRNTIKAGLNVGAANAFWLYNNNLLMQSNAAAGDSGNAYELADNTGVTLRQVQVSSVWVGATGTGSRVGGFAPTGTATVAGLQAAIRTVTTATDTATSDDHTILCNATTAASTESLPASPVTGALVAYKKTDASANTCTLSGNGKNLDAGTTIVLSTQYKYVQAQYNGTQWWIIANN